MAVFQLQTEFTPKGDQPEAIRALNRGLDDGKPHQCLLGVTGSGKTFTMANVIEHYGKPTLVISHNKTLAAQLYSEFREFFPDNAVQYFVSYYDYYQPEAYIPQRDIYIEKDASINPDLDRLRLAATSSLSSREDVIIVASVSCIYGLGDPEDYQEMTLTLGRGQTLDRDEALLKLVKIQYNRNDTVFQRGTFRVRGDVVEIFPAYEEFGYRVELFGDEVDAISAIDPLTGQTLAEEDAITVYPAKHFVMPQERITGAIERIEAELAARLEEFKSQGKFLEAQRLEARTRYDMELMQEIGYCPGIENYSQPLSGRPPGSRPFTLIDYFPEDFLLVIDESHVTVPQVRGMYNGDHSRKTTLVEHGFRLPSALDNRPMMFDEFETKIHRVVFVSATPGPYELEKVKGEVVEQIIRPTGLVDPRIRVESARGQVEHLLGEVKARVEAKERTLVTTLTKRLAEDLSTFIDEAGVKTAYLHSEIDTIERVEILKKLRLGTYDCVVGVNLLREGLDLPEVSLVAILDADKEGFLRSETSLIQTIGRTARNVNAEVILYADHITNSMRRAIDETNRRRDLQVKYNTEHDITPTTIKKAIRAGIETEVAARRVVRDAAHLSEAQRANMEYIRELEDDMRRAADELDFEEAARLRDHIAILRGRTPIGQQVQKRRKRRGKRPPWMPKKRK
ncbi:MAG TPA: excinuclease ABC subunit UvrB [Planctomycetota bacterium]|nr:excinuclease ABC subunit UvrB [Planctomycetota bacterium]